MLKHITFLIAIINHPFFLHHHGLTAVHVSDKNVCRGTMFPVHVVIRYLAPGVSIPRLVRCQEPQLGCQAGWWLMVLVADDMLVDDGSWADDGNAWFMVVHGSDDGAVTPAAGPVWSPGLGQWAWPLPGFYPWWPWQTDRMKQHLQIIDIMHFWCPKSSTSY